MPAALVCGVTDAEDLLYMHYITMLSRTPQGRNALQLDGMVVVAFEQMILQRMKG